MRLVLFTQNGMPPTPGLLTERGVVGLERHGLSPQAEMVALIDRFADVRADLERRAAAAEVIPTAEVQLLPPLPRPGKILCSTATYGGSQAAERPQLLLTLKSAESVIGPGQTVQLPPVGDQWQFQPEAELGLVIRGPARTISAADWQRAVFGYTCVIDVMASGDQQFGRDFWLAKSDTLGPLGPCIVTADEIADPQHLRVRSWVNGQPAQDYAMADADYTVAEQIELATTIMTLRTGDVLACGTSRAGLGPVADGDDVQVEIDGVGRLQVRVAVLSEVRA
ncbi:MAG: fumarylacetoacetate hydrolase family protein [Chloroflexi bacterium]|nr:fumarylacetoacetate hydrolase family protein [Chloroflexota bacterium]